jgi:hypothetical protein
MRVPTGQVFSHKLGVFATDSYADQATLSSSMHQVWAIKYGSTMRIDVNYSPSDVFLTFPRPEPTAHLTAAGKELDEQRREIMLRRDLGPTDLYNLVNDPDRVGDDDIDRLREIHAGVDEAVMAAYGWPDIELKHGFHTYRQMRRWTISPLARVKVMDLLLEENQRREKVEKATAPIRKTASRGRGRKNPSGTQEGLF